MDKCEIGYSITNDNGNSCDNTLISTPYCCHEVNNDFDFRKLNAVGNISFP